MSILNPVRQQYNRLMEAFHGKNYLSMEEVALALRVPKIKISKSLFQMEKKGLFSDDVPVVDSSASLVLRNRKVAAFATAEGILASIQKTLHELTPVIEKFDRHQLEKIRSGRAKNIGQAILSFAENAIDGKRIDQSFYESAHGYIQKRRRAAEEKLDMTGFAAVLQKQVSQLKDYVRKHPEHLYPEEFRTILLSMKTDLANWGNAVNHADTDDRWYKACELVENLLQYVQQFDHLKELAEIHIVPVSPKNEVRKEIALTVSYLESIKDDLTDYRVRASVLQLLAILKQLDEAYFNATDGFSSSDARSLKNIYLPMLRSLLEKYLKYEGKCDEGALADYKPDDTLSVLESDLPKALKRIRDELLILRTSAMEDEATALRQKLELDGLL